MSTQDDAYATSGIDQGSAGNTYDPWIDGSPYTLDAVITTSGTSLITYWNGVEIDVGAGVIAGFNNVSSFTLSDWGFGAGGTVVGDDFTTGEMRLGNINIAGPGGHDIAFAYDAVVFKDTEGGTFVFDPDGDGIPEAVPETSSFALFAGFCVLAGALLARRHC